MPSLTTLALFALATTIFAAAPGPGVLYVVARTAAQGRRAGLISMLGIELGDVVWIVAGASGVAATLSASTEALALLRYGGAAYLIFLGVQRWRDVSQFHRSAVTVASGIFLRGSVTQLLNPKVALFFVAFLPQFLNATAPIAQQVLVLGGAYIAIAITVDTCYVLTAAAITTHLIESRGAQRLTNRVAATTYIALGLAAAASGLRRGV